MLLYEFAGPDPLRVKLIAVSNQLKGEIEQGQQPKDWKVDDLLTFFRKNDIIVAKSDLYDMIKNPPLNQVIANIKGDDVIFKGQGSELDVDADQSESDKVVDQMAKKAMK